LPAELSGLGVERFANGDATLECAPFPEEAFSVNSSMRSEKLFIILARRAVSFSSRLRRSVNSAIECSLLAEPLDPFSSINCELDRRIQSRSSLSVVRTTFLAAVGREIGNPNFCSHRWTVRTPFPKKEAISFQEVNTFSPEFADISCLTCSRKTCATEPLCRFRIPQRVEVETSDASEVRFRSSFAMRRFTLTNEYL